jgi:hypothetical protein
MFRQYLIFATESEKSNYFVTLAKADVARFLGRNTPDFAAFRLRQHVSNGRRARLLPSQTRLSGSEAAAAPSRR